MSGGHAHAVDPGRPLDGPIERLAPEAKIVGTVVFVLAVVAVPPHAIWPYLIDAVIALAVAVVALLPLRVVASRLVFEVPFIALALAMVAFGGDPRVTIGPLSLSEPGLWAAWQVVARSTLAVVAASILASTTTGAELVMGLERLRLPPVIITISAFTVRYVVVLREELDRMRLAQSLRGAGRRARPGELASLAAVLFVRSFERGERVHMAMTARGGSVQRVELVGGGARDEAAPAAAARIAEAEQPRRGGSWLIAVSPGLAAAVVMLVAWILR